MRDVIRILIPYCLTSGWNLLWSRKNITSYMPHIFLYLYFGLDQKQEQSTDSTFNSHQAMNSAQIFDPICRTDKHCISPRSFSRPHMYAFLAVTTMHQVHGFNSCQYFHNISQADIQETKQKPHFSCNLPRLKTVFIPPIGLLFFNF